MKCIANSCQQLPTLPSEHCTRRRICLHNCFEALKAMYRNIQVAKLGPRLLCSFFSEFNLLSIKKFLLSDSDWYEPVQPRLLLEGLKVTQASPFKDTEIYIYIFKGRSPQNIGLQDILCKLQKAIYVFSITGSVHIVAHSA